MIYPIKGAIFDHIPDCTCTNCVAPKVPLQRMVDDFGFPSPAVEITKEDCELVKRFLGNLKDQTLSRGIHKVLGDLLERLP